MRKARFEVRGSDHGREARARGVARGGQGAKKKSVFFDERSHYVIENKESEKRTKPNEANSARGKNIGCDG